LWVPAFAGTTIVQMDKVSADIDTKEMAGREPGHRIKVSRARYVCWIAESSQWPPRTRMKVQISVASSDPPWVTRPLSRSMV
jgi:hypothetical protein